ncbi:MAG: putative glyoxalase superfamily protein PhnB [Planctomycetota bacterium]
MQDNLTLGVRDLKKSVAFYEQGLSFPRMESPLEVAFFTLNGTRFGLYGREALAEDATVSAEGHGFASFALAHNVESDAEVNEVIDQAVEAGATLVKEPQKVFWGGYSGYFKDLDGHLWEVAHNPWVGSVHVTSSGLSIGGTKELKRPYANGSLECCIRRYLFAKGSVFIEIQFPEIDKVS